MHCAQPRHYTSAVPTTTATATYPSTSFGMFWLALQRRPRSFRQDARPWIDRLSPPLRIEGAIPEVEHGSWLVVVNHYSRPGFRAWWFSMAISAVLTREVCWITTSALTFPDWFRSHTVTPASRWFLRHTAELYGFIPMPPMPPSPREIEARAVAVRRALRRAREPETLLGLAPEGGDMPGGVLGPPPAGSGRFLRRLAQCGLRFAPVGAYEDNGRLCLHFGPPFDLPAEIPEPVDERASAIVMSAIAACLPPHLRGCYG